MITTTTTTGQDDDRIDALERQLDKKESALVVKDRLLIDKDKKLVEQRKSLQKLEIQNKELRQQLALSKAKDTPLQGRFNHITKQVREIVGETRGALAHARTLTHISTHT